MERRLTRSRAVPTATDGISEVTKFLTELTQAAPASVEEPSFRLYVETTLKQLGKTVTTGPNRVVLSDAFLQVLESKVTEAVEKVLGRAYLVSRHRAGFNEGTAQRITPTDSFLLHKEDVAMHGETAFNEAEYRNHSLEEEDRLLLSTRSVLRISCRDVLAVLNGIEIPASTHAQLVNKIVAHELALDFRIRHS